MRWSFSTHAFTDRSVHAAVAAIAALGYAGVEILADRPHADPVTLDKTGIGHLSRLLETSGVFPASLNANTVSCYYGRDFWEPLFEPSLANPDPAARRWRRSQVRRCLLLAEALGCPHISVTPGRPVPGIDPRRSTDLLTASLRQLAVTAAAAGVRIGLEYEPGLLVGTADDLADLLDLVDSPWVGANLNIGHSVVAGEKLEPVLARLHGRIFHVHLEDIRGRRHYHLIPGEGDIDFAAVLDSLDRHGYGGFLTVELYQHTQAPEDAARRALAYLAALRQPATAVAPPIRQETGSRHAGAGQGWPEVGGNLPLTGLA
jgi:sugar phosphate isomerase/epimerase